MQLLTIMLRVYSIMCDSLMLAGRAGIEDITLPGSHATPCGADLTWQVCTCSLTPCGLLPSVVRRASE